MELKQYDLLLQALQECALCCWCLSVSLFEQTQQVALHYLPNCRVLLRAMGQAFISQTPTRLASPEEKTYLVLSPYIHKV